MKPEKFLQANRLLRVVLLLVTAMAFGNCKERKVPRVVERSFYFWKSSFDLGSLEQKAITELKLSKLYVKFFDVAWNASSGEPMPIAVIKFPPNSQQPSLQIVPTVFITLDCISNLKEAQLPDLARKITGLIKNIASSNTIALFPEIQLDCDWTGSTKDRYFKLLQEIKQVTSKVKITLSATIRLHQFKYVNKSGIPPVDRGLLMCYNMGNLKNPDTRNSILQTDDLKKYLGTTAPYSLPLDIGLPIFNWKVLFRKNIFAGLLRELPASELNKNAAIKKSGNRYTVLEPVIINGYNFLAGDMIRDEEIAYNDLLNAADMLSNKIKTPNLRVVLYHLDSITLSKFSIHELETVFDRFH